jgi:hypothetical protein
VTDYQQLYEQEVAVSAEKEARYEARIMMLEHELEQIKKMIFGTRQERFIAVENNPAQLTLAMQAEEVQATSLSSAQKISYTRKGTQELKAAAPAVRMKLPDHLPRVDLVLEPEQKTDTAKKMSEEVTE